MYFKHILLTDIHNCIIKARKKQGTYIVTSQQVKLRIKKKIKKNMYYSSRTLKACVQINNLFIPCNRLLSIIHRIGGYSQVTSIASNYETVVQYPGNSFVLYVQNRRLKCLNIKCVGSLGYSYQLSEILSNLSFNYNGIKVR